jgi:hypothetical protein
VRDTPFKVNTSLIGSITGAPIFSESVYPYLLDTFPKKTTMIRVFVGKNIPSWPHQNVVVKIVQFSEPMSILSKIVPTNLWPFAHYNDFSVDRAAFLYAFPLGYLLSFPLMLFGSYLQLMRIVTFLPCLAVLSPESALISRLSLKKMIPLSSL